MDRDGGAALFFGWAIAVPFVLRSTNENTATTLGRLGLEEHGSELTGERHGRRVVVRIDAAGSRTRIAGVLPSSRLEGDALRERAGRGAEETWDGVAMETGPDGVEVRRDGHTRATWLWDLWLAERLAR